MRKTKTALRGAAKTALAVMAVEGLAGAMVAGGARWAGRRMRDRGRNRAIRAAGHTVVLATALLPAGMMLRRRFLGG